MIKKVVKVERKTIIVRIPLLECGHRARAIQGRCKIAYYCAVCVAKDARAQERKKGKKFFEGEGNE